MVAPDVPLPLLPHNSVHEESEQTVLILHGAFSSSRTWTPIYPELTAFHILTPSLPHHADAASIGPLSLEYTTALLAELLRAKAHGGTAHIVGHSFGANMALHFATRHPQLIRSLLVTGTGGLPRSALMPYGLSADGLVNSLVPNRLIEYLIDVHEEWQGFESFGGLRSLDLCREIATILGISMSELLPSDVRQGLAEKGVRILAVAATKKGLLPTDDNVPRAKEIAKLLGGVAVKIPTMRHAWHIQDPVLFGAMIVSWINDQPLPSAFQPL